MGYDSRPRIRLCRWQGFGDRIWGDLLGLDNTCQCRAGISECYGRFQECKDDSKCAIGYSCEIKEEHEVEQQDDKARYQFFRKNGYYPTDDSIPPIKRKIQLKKCGKD
jgi:hypothetical protein